MAEFLQEYAGLIKGLTRNEKRDINVLSMLAEDNKQYAAGIVSTIENHILTCPAPSKLPALYVVDSIVKNVGDPYTQLFSQRLPEVFGAVWSSAMQDRRGSLGRLYNTWAGVFAPDVLEQVQARMVSTSSRLPAQPAALQPMAGAPPMQLGQQQGMAYQVAGGAVMAAPQQLLQQPQQLPFQQQQQPVYMATTDLRGWAGQPQVQSFQYAQPQQQQPMYYDSQAQQPMYGAADGMSMPQQQFHDAPMQQQPMQYDQLQPMQQQQHMGSEQFHPMDQQAHLAGGGISIQTASPVDTTWQQQGQQQLQPLQQPPPQQPVYHPPPQDPRRAHRSPSPLIHAVPPTPPMPSQPVSPPMPSKPAIAGPVTGTGGGAPASAALTSMQLSSLLSTLAKTGVLGGGSAASRIPSPEEDPAIRTLDFTPAFLKTFYKAVVAELQRGSNRTRKDILDAAFTRKQRQKTAAAASRQWFVGVDAWIAGTLAVSEAAPAFFEEQAAKEQAAEEPVHNEPEDPFQSECAISGEPFDNFYAAAAPDGSTDEGWFYRDAVRLYGEEAARYGVPDGSIVKAKCLAEAGHADSSAAVGGVVDAAELAADMAAAAAGADAAGAATSGEGVSGAAGGVGVAVVNGSISAGGSAAEPAEEAKYEEKHEDRGAWVKPEQEDGEAAVKMEALEGAEVAATGAGVKRSAEGDGYGAEPAKRARGGE